MSGGHSATLTYDPLGRLWQVVSPSGTTRFVYDGAHDVVETDGSGNALRAFVWGPGADEPLVWWEGAGPKMLHADERGSIVAVADSSGNLIGINKYDEYGVPASTNVGRFQYTGQAWLSEIGLYYYKARMYSPTLGRFMQTDPAGYAAGVNRYEAMGGDPVNSTDPSGMENDTVDEKIVQGIPRIDSPDLGPIGWRVGYNPIFGREAGGRLEAMAFEADEARDRAEQERKEENDSAAVAGNFVLTGSFSTITTPDILNSDPHGGDSLVRSWETGLSGTGIIEQWVSSVVWDPARGFIANSFIESWPRINGIWLFGNTDSFEIKPGHPGAWLFVSTIAYYYPGVNYYGLTNISSVLVPGGVDQAGGLPACHCLLDPLAGHPRIGPISTTFTTTSP